MDLAIAETVDGENPIAGDLRLVDGQIALVEGVEAIAQDIRTRLRWFKGEWFLDARTGFPWFERVLGQKVTERVVEMLLRRTIMRTPGVAQIASMRVSIDRRSRELSATFSALSVDGEVVDFSDFVLGDVAEAGT
jgi:hypothetical protein